MGPLKGLKVIEMRGIGPGPFCGMLLADMGADVVCVDRANQLGADGGGVLGRSKRSIAVDLKHDDGRETLLKLVEQADVLLEGYRPGVMERLGIGPDVCLACNERLIYGRMTGWGQDGPLAPAAGHDINYIALSGALHAIGEAGGRPIPPLNLVGDFGGGAMFLALGIVAALHERSASGRGQVVDAAMTHGAAMLMNPIFGVMQSGGWHERGTNQLDTGAHFYNTYETKDGKYVSVGPLEPQFYALLLQKLGLEQDPEFLQQTESEQWPALKARLAEVFKSKTRDEWDAILLGTDTCYAPVLSFAEAQQHPHHKARGTFVNVNGNVQVAPAPRFDRTVPDTPSPTATMGAHTNDVLAQAGFSSEQIEALRKAGAIA